MATPMVRSSSVPSLPPPSPKSPPEYPDLFGKRREMARVQMLERERTFLEEELKSVEGLQPASRCCKEIADYVMANPDPLIPSNKKNRRSCGFWKWLCGMPCFNLSWICCCCCCGGLSVHPKLPRICCDCKPCNCSCSCLPSINCSLPKWRCCCSYPKSHCCKESCAFGNCCTFPSSCNFRCPPCPSCCSCKCTCTCSCPSCPKVSSRCRCTESCWNPGCLCC
ncbi:guanine nucleotide-binding protein subunit gamma 3-like [Gastrolobium bilobum]|uniref:guanine nucleotide-binding protein subunit gamma 3-like n=1 Tax=Gastrolobium bilobum TaxID=150636 RepID=UPI002AB22E71|nr:guanine nucleotide-binding protein subunit gamma 3-like [Gastrolobium bilobum]